MRFKKPFTIRKAGRAQSFIEYTLLIGISVAALLAVVSGLLRGPKQGAFTSYFNSAKTAIVGVGN